MKGESLLQLLATGNIAAEEETLDGQQVGTTQQFSLCSDELYSSVGLLWGFCFGFIICIPFRRREKVERGPLSRLSFLARHACCSARSNGSSLLLRTHIHFPPYTGKNGGN